MMTRIIPILMILGAIGLFMGYVNPTYAEKVKGLQAEIRDYEAALASAKRFQQKELELAAQRDQIPVESLRRLENFLPDSVDNVQIILDLNSLAARSGMQLSDFDISGPEINEGGQAEGAPVESPEPVQETGMGIPVYGAEEPVEYLDLSVTAVGTYEAFRTFLAGVEGSLRPLDVVELNIQDSQTGVYTYEITFRLYWLR